MPLNPSQQVEVANASPSDVEDFFSDLIPHFLNKQWLPPGNKYVHDCVSTLKNDLAGGTISHADLGQYIAASAPIHCVDGWTYWGRALGSHCRGDLDSSRHLAYYAELRAAMSFLATRGIGIFDHQHIVIRSGKTCHHLPAAVRRGKPKQQGTHEITWYVMEYWPSLPGSDQALLDVVSPQGIPLTIWLNQFHNSAAVTRALTKDWLKMWGLDLNRFAYDQKSRNQSSYRPTQYPKKTQVAAKELSKFASQIWRMFEPAASPFRLLDDHLLRLSLQFAYKLRTGNSHISHAAPFEADVKRTVNALLSSQTEKHGLVEFILERRDPGLTRLLAEAQRTDVPAHPGHHMQVIARAALLLRIASGFVERLLSQSGVTKTNLDFWINEFMVSRGLWNDTAHPPDKLTDLWGDIEESLLQEEAWQGINNTSSPSISDWRENRMDVVARLGEGERVVTWGWRL